MTEQEAEVLGREAFDVFREDAAPHLAAHPLSTEFRSALDTTLFMGGIECAHAGCDDGGPLQAAFGVAFLREVLAVSSQ